MFFELKVSNDVFQSCNSLPNLIGRSSSCKLVFVWLGSAQRLCLLTCHFGCQIFAKTILGKSFDLVRPCDHTRNLAILAMQI